MDGRTGWRLRFAHGSPIRFRPVGARISPANPDGSIPGASATNMRLAANVPEYFAVTPGHYLSVISNS